jgi:hypothetical protein
MLLVALLGRDSGFWLAGTGYVLIGFGYGTAVPLVSSHVMGDVPARLAGTGSGILNSARQVGASVGIAVMGAIGVSIATHVWDSKTATLPLAVQADARGLGQQVAGGQTRQIVARLGAVAQEPVTDSFLTGYHWAMAAGTVALAAAGTTALIGLRRRKPARTPIGARSGVLLPEER